MNAAQKGGTRIDPGREIEQRDQRQRRSEQQGCAQIAKAPAALTGGVGIQSPSAVPSVCENVIVIQ